MFYQEEVCVEAGFGEEGCVGCEEGVGAEVDDLVG